jgi:hypothetical protein
MQWGAIGRLGAASLFISSWGARSSCWKNPTRFVCVALQSLLSPQDGFVFRLADRDCSSESLSFALCTIPHSAAGPDENPPLRLSSLRTYICTHDLPNRKQYFQLGQDVRFSVLSQRDKTAGWGKFKLKLICDRQSVGQSVLVLGAHLGPLTNFPFSLKFPSDICVFVIL